MNVMLRNMAADLHPIEVMFLRNLFGFVVLLPFLLRGAHVLRTKRIGTNIVRSAAHFTGMALWVYALTLVPLATANALLFSSPLFVAIGALAFLGERADIGRWCALLAGFAGVMIIYQPGSGSVSIGGGVVLLCAVLLAISKLLTKRVVQTDSTLSAIFYLNVFTCLCALGPAIAVWEWPTGEQYGWFAALGVVGGIAHFCMTRAVALADLTMLQPFEFTALLWAAVIGFVLYAEIPSASVFLGGISIIAAATYIAQRESSQAKEVAKRAKR